MKAPAPILALALLTASGALWLACSGPLLKLPKLTPGQSAPASDGLDALAQSLSRCANLDALTAEIAVSGSVGGHHVRGRLLAGFTESARSTSDTSSPVQSARLEAVAPFGQPFFIFVAVGDEATILLPRADRVLTRARPDRVLEALTGLRIGPRELMQTLTGCVARDPQATALAAGDDWRVVRNPDVSEDHETAEIFIHRLKASAPWRLIAVIHAEQAAGESAGTVGSGWRAEYRDTGSSLPTTVRLVSLASGRFDLQLTLSQVDTRATLAPDAFQIKIPASAQPITLDELRANGPFAPEPKR